MDLRIPFSFKMEETRTVQRELESLLQTSIPGRQSLYPHWQSAQAYYCPSAPSCLCLLDFSWSSDRLVEVARLNCINRLEPHTVSTLSDLLVHDICVLNENVNSFSKPLVREIQFELLHVARLSRSWKLVSESMNCSHPTETIFVRPVSSRRI